MKLASFLSPPVLRAAEGEDDERSATWLELFFDLVFVVAIAQLALALADDLSAGGFLRFGLLFVPVWWSWAGYTNYADRFDTDDVGFRVMMLAGMLAMAALAVNVPEAFSGGSGAFAASYVAVRVGLILLYERARRHVPAARDLCRVTMSVFVVGTTLWAISLFVPEPYRFGLWGLALLIEVSTPWIARRAMASAPMHASHLPERYGLFTIIVLGESLVAIALGLGDTDWQLRSALVAVAGFVAAASLWWVYFDFIDVSDIKRGLLSRNVFIYGHLGIALGLTATGVGIKKAILYADEAAFPTGAAWALFGGATLFLVAVSLIYAVSIHTPRDRVLLARVAAAAATLLLAIVGPPVSPFWLIGLLLLTLLSLLAFEVVEKASRTVPETSDSASMPEESN
ncbi:MAG: low temperature requirement protein A [Rubrobacteraceae bacterium]